MRLLCRDPDAKLTLESPRTLAESLVTVRGGEDGLVLVVTPPAGEAGDLFPPRRSLPVERVELLDETLAGDLTTALRAPGTLRYPDYPAVDEFPIEGDELVALGRPESLYLERLALNAEAAALALRLDGVVDRARTAGPPAGRGTFPVDRRLTLFHVVRHGWRWSLLAAVVAWALSTTWIAYERWQKLS